MRAVSLLIAHTANNLQMTITRRENLLRTTILTWFTESKTKRRTKLNKGLKIRSERKVAVFSSPFTSSIRICAFQDWSEPSRWASGWLLFRTPARQPFQIQVSASWKKHMIMELRWRLYLGHALWLSLSPRVVFQVTNSILVAIFRKRQVKGRKRSCQ